MNWGTKIVLFFIAFVAFMVFMVVKSSQQNTDLVATDYYERELAYDGKVEKMENARNLKEGLKTRFQNNQLIVQLPRDENKNQLQGKAIFQRPSDKSLDVEVDIDTDTSGVQFVDLSMFSKGMYVAEFNWTDGNKDFSVKKSVLIP